MAGGFLAPAAGCGVGGERFGVGALQLQHGRKLASERKLGQCSQMLA